jgi:hypothetical protein
MEKRYVLNLTDEERLWLEDVCNSRASVLKRKRARILLEIDEGATDEEAADAAEADVKTAGRIRKRCVLEGIEPALERKKQVRPSRQRVLDGRAEAMLVHIACSERPAGRSEWTMKLLANRLVELEVVDAVSATTVQRTLKKTKQNHGK